MLENGKCNVPSQEPHDLEARELDPRFRECPHEQPRLSPTGPIYDAGTGMESPRRSSSRPHDDPRISPSLEDPGRFAEADHYAEGLRERPQRSEGEQEKRFAENHREETLKVFWGFAMFFSRKKCSFGVNQPERFGRKKNIFYSFEWNGVYCFRPLLW